MFDTKSIKISKKLYEGIDRYIADTKFKSVDAFIEDFLEKELMPKFDEKEVEKRLKGLGYIE